MSTSTSGSRRLPHCAPAWAAVTTLPASVSASMTRRPGPQTAIERANEAARTFPGCASAFIVRLSVAKHPPTRRDAMSPARRWRDYRNGETKVNCAKRAPGRRRGSETELQAAEERAVRAVGTVLVAHVPIGVGGLAGRVPFVGERHPALRVDRRGRLPC